MQIIRTRVQVEGIGTVLAVRNSAGQWSLFTRRERTVKGTRKVGPWGSNHIFTATETAQVIKLAS